MANIIQEEHRATGATTRVIYRPAPFNFVDMQEKADAYLETVRAEAARISEEVRSELTQLRNAVNVELAQKRRELQEFEQNLAERERLLEAESQRVHLLRDEIEEAAYDEAIAKGHKEGYDCGHKEGYAAGEKQALTDYRERLQQEADTLTKEAFQTMMPALESAVDKLASAKNLFLTSWEEGAVQVAAAIARQAISRELPNMIDVPLHLLREALELSVGSVRLKIRMNAQDIETLRQEIDTLVAKITPAAETELVADGRVSPGGCYLETTYGTIDERLESRLERIVSELGQR
ncbi:MAG: FliH/SctL family protein [Planctomycetaceae bacterium]|nr:FliH/SctL family protein [Planctomycetaceae bacterium]